jgi:hypothetical protein
MLVMRIRNACGPWIERGAFKIDACAQYAKVPRLIAGELQ